MKKQKKVAAKKPAGKPAKNKSASAVKRGAQPAKAKTQAKKSDIRKGAALRTRDEHLQNGVPKEEYKDKPKQFYRVVYTIAVNELNEVAVVKQTTKRGRHLKSRPSEKFREQVVTKDNENNGIKVGDKFVRSKSEDITQEDVDYIISRLKHYPDTEEKMREFKSRGKGKKNPPK